MILDLVLFAAGLAALYFGAEWLVGGASRLASSYGISPVVVGLTIVAFGTSAPELVVSGLASLRGSGDLAVGNVVGSNIANIALILGASALIRPIAVNRGLLVRDVPIMIGFAVLFLLMAWNLGISRLEGGALLALFAAYMFHVGRAARRESAEASAMVAKEKEIMEGMPGGKPKPRRDLLLTVAGTVTLVVGAQLLVGAATSIARAFGVSEIIIGMTLVAFGTSVPELAASVVASIRGEAEIVIGNIVGSNIFNVTLVLGTAALIRPLPIDASIPRLEGPLMLALSVILLPFTFTKLCLNRWEGGVLLAGYGIFIGWIVM
ncbi:MAG: calcium/sodium antiporter [Gemmatimonadetes bacterium]|nr:calcium/sodium antiporter [Gemmatimonadota bacterium]